ncbi:MAG: hypothetical protein ABII81_10900 [Pseudomonadota bacterium]
MFIAHFGVGFGAKKFVPSVSLGTLFLAAQFIDLLWPSLLMLDLEQVRIQPGATAVTPLLFEHYPISHSLLAVIGWGALLATAHIWLKQNVRDALILGALVVSHWLLDVLVHRPDLPLMPGGETLLGLHGWSSLPLTLALEGSLFALGVWLYASATSALDAKGRWGFYALVAFLALIYAGNLFGEPPPNVQVLAWAGQAQWLLVLWGYWLDGHRHAVTR